MIPTPTRKRVKRSGISVAAAAIVIVLVVTASAVGVVVIQSNSSVARTQSALETSTLIQTDTTTVSQPSAAGDLIQSGGGKASLDLVRLESYNYQSIESGVVITVIDAGSTTVAISSVYFDGRLQTSVASGCATGSPSIYPTGTCTFTLVPAVAPASGTSHTVKIVTSTGGTSVISVVAGTSG